jgi:hypothetical protein
MRARMGILALYATPLSAKGCNMTAVCHHLTVEVDVHIVDVYLAKGLVPCERCAHRRRSSTTTLRFAGAQ